MSLLLTLIYKAPDSERIGELHRNEDKDAKRRAEENFVKQHENVVDERVIQGGEDSGERNTEEDFSVYAGVEMAP